MVLKMSMEEHSGQIDIALIVVGFSILIVGILYYLGFPIPGILLLILGISAIIVGVLRVFVSVYHVISKDD